MFYSPAKPGFHNIDGVKVHTDSRMEADFIKHLVKQGFSKKWRRRRWGIVQGVARYTPDVEISIDDNGVSKRALVEFKPSNTREFSMQDKKRMIISSKYYKTIILLLYINKTNQWFEINQDSSLRKCTPPKPGTKTITQLPEYWSMPLIGPYGRVYRSKLSTQIAKVFLSTLNSFIKVISK